MFGQIYYWFSSMYGKDLDDYLYGITQLVDSAGNEVWNPNRYIMFGLIALGSALLIAFTYYYIINSAGFNKFWSWLIMMLVTGILNLFVGAGITIGYLNSGDIDRCLLENGQNVLVSNCWMFGVANMIIAIIFFFIISMAIKWWSCNCSKSPF